MTPFADDLSRLVDKALQTGYAKGRKDALAEQYNRAVRSNVTALGVLAGIVFGFVAALALVGGS